ncbi:arginine deiminase family protein [Aliifodinibius sp. S!AR15-10]|uniref:arginine deiminase n=1 Tax=Aliifodinibius sp. S!AR15-10 TaxID=2950437 RepID=UPI002866A039|nr:arginine deiminase family protein [Aliifodinibius sp. S!AR15-10]MDR8393462.1 arginine deiminase family protein [Aliifodinibius sp. S!AR15-10]
MKLNVSSEIGRLQGVIVHTPGREVSLVNPELKDELLFDDIVFEEDARREHLDMLDIFRAAMSADGQIFEITDLIRDCFQMDQQEARAFFVEQLIKRYPQGNLHTVKKELLTLPPDELLRFAIEGTTAKRNFILNPTPNLLFTRDLAAVVNNNVLLSRPAKVARIREFLLMEILVRYHPLLAGLQPNILTIAEQETIEGGDVLVASKDLTLIGMSERTSFSGLMTAAEGLLSNGVKTVLAVDIPKQRSSMHLDTIFTFASRDECLVFPPAITEREKNVVRLSNENGAVNAEVMPSLKQALEECMEHSFTFINCGGESRTNQFREQWTDGANVFALAPGVIVGYERNTNTFNALKEHGYEVINQFNFIEEYQDSPFEPGSKKIAIGFEGNELCRGRGGARCMTLPISRES